MDYHGFYTGTVFNAYEYLGAHPSGDGGTSPVRHTAAPHIHLPPPFSGMLLA